jgi:hypothetical protein
MPTNTKIYRLGITVTLAAPPFHTGKIVAKAEVDGRHPSGSCISELVAVRWKHNGKAELVDWRRLVTPAHGPLGIRVYQLEPRPRYGRIALPGDKTPGVARLMSAIARLKGRAVVVWDDGTRSIERLKTLTHIPPCWPDDEEDTSQLQSATPSSSS